ncbi:Sodium/hydrogen exchanger [Rhodotorula sp. JG-1b]|nr:Sodium/hydrogen exchanger [Rhodotorula sp. JG-1b]
MPATASSIAAPGTVPYAEPHFPQLATVIALLYLAQVARGITSRLFYAGLLGEIAVGVIFGPVAKILEESWMETFLLVGYIGLVLIVFEGGLTMQPSSFVPQLPLACVTALVGVLAPIALTFGLYHGYGYPTIDAFAAGSALASTSLGTTFFVLRAAGPELGVSAVGEILKGAALIDDVIALVLLATIEPLASNGGDTSDLGWTVGRPIVTSLAMAVVTPVAAVWIFVPIFRWRRLSGWVARGGHNAELFLGVAVLSAFLAIADYAGTTMLLGAFLAGYFLSALPAPGSAVSFVACWDAYLLPIHEHIFVPLFFISIGFSIPFLQLWTGKRIWRGIVYAILMTIGKLLAGLPVLIPSAEENGDTALDSRPPPSIPSNTFAEKATSDSVEPRGVTRGSLFLNETLPAAAFVGMALVARGEIGVLVLQVARSASADSTSPVLGEEAYLTGLWAVALCTIAGPIAFGFLVKRYGETIKRGPWGILANA